MFYFGKRIFTPWSIVRRWRCWWIDVGNCMCGRRLSMGWWIVNVIMLTGRSGRRLCHRLSMCWWIANVTMLAGRSGRRLSMCWWIVNVTMLGGRCGRRLCRRLSLCRWHTLLVGRSLPPHRQDLQSLIRTDICKKMIIYTYNIIITIIYIYIVK